MRRLLAFVFASAPVACTLLVDTSGLTSADAPAREAGATDRSGEATTDGPAAKDSAGPDVVADVVDAPIANAYREAVLADSPIAYFRLGEGAGAGAATNEVSPSTFMASYGGIPVFGVEGAIVGDPNTAVRFDDGTSARLDLGTVATSADATSSVELWFKPVAVPPSSSRFLFDHVGVAGGPRYDLFAFDAKLEYEHNDGLGNVDGLYPAMSLATGVWHHVVITSAPGAAGGLKIYLDGQLAAQATPTLSFAEPPSPLYFGAKISDPSNNGAGGALDEIAFYGTALTADRILAHYRIGSGT